MLGAGNLVPFATTAPGQKEAEGGSGHIALARRATCTSPDQTPEIARSQSVRTRASRRGRRMLTGRCRTANRCVEARAVSYLAGVDHAWAAGALEGADAPYIQRHRYMCSAFFHSRCACGGGFNWSTVRAPAPGARVPLGAGRAWGETNVSTAYYQRSVPRRASASLTCVGTRRVSDG